MNQLKTFLLLFLIIIIGFSLRWYDLGTESLWIDEAFSVHHAELPSISENIKQVILTEGAPPGYYILLHGWITLFGNSEIAVRSLSVLFGVFSIIVLFFLVRLFFSEGVALLSSLFLATSMLQILLSQEARLYSLFTFLTIFATYILAIIFIRMKQNETAIFWWGLYCLVIALAFYVNYVAFVLVLFYFMFLFIQWRKLSVYFRYIFILIHGVLFALAMGLYYFSGNVLIQQFFSLNIGLTNSLISKHLPSFLAQLGLFFYALPFILFFIVIFLVFIAWKKKSRFVNFNLSDTWFFSFVSLWGVLYIYLCLHTLTLFDIPLTQNPITQSYFLIRHSFFLVPLLYVYVAYKICTMRQKIFAVAVIVAILLVNIIALSVYYQQTTKAPWREAMDYIQENSSHSPLLLLDKGSFSNEFLLNYYFNSSFTLIKLTFSEEKRKLIKMGDEEVWQAIQGKEDFWLILYKNVSTKDYYKDLLDTRYVMDISKDFNGIKIYHYRTRNI